MSTDAIPPLCEDCNHEMTVHEQPKGRCHEPDCACRAFMWTDLLCDCGHSVSAHVGLFVSLPMERRACEWPGCDCQGFA